MSGKVAAVILAAGEGKRMHSALPKVCHRLSGLPMIAYPLRLSKSLRLTRTIVVTSGNRQRNAALRQAISGSSWFHGCKKGLSYAVQKRQLGTGDAMRAALAGLRGFSGTVLVLYGDVPLVDEAEVRAFLQFHREGRGPLSLISAILPNPFGYGRIVRDSRGQLRRIVEERDASVAEKTIAEINTGTYAMDADFLRQMLANLTRENAQGEYYLTDLAHLAREERLPVQIYATQDQEGFQGVNTLADLARVETLGRRRRNIQLAATGVWIGDLGTCFVEPGSEVTPGARLEAGTHILGRSQVAAGAQLGPFVVVKDSSIGPSAVVKPFSVLDQAEMAAETSCGPFAHLRPGSKLKKGARVGNFVEMKKTVLGAFAKANHLTYLGDAVVGEHANVGAGTITCNYDGYDKFQTRIGAHAFIGSDTQLVAPVVVGAGAVVAAGSTVTKNVPRDALTLSRTPQVNRPGWAARRRRQKARRGRKK